MFEGFRLQCLWDFTASVKVRWKMCAVSLILSSLRVLLREGSSSMVAP